MKHTKGPWRLDLKNGILFQPTVKNESGDLLADVYSPVSITNDECIANAQLIASAPELLEALEDCLDLLNYNEEDRAHDLADEVRALIRKAKGEQK